MKHSRLLIVLMMMINCVAVIIAQSLIILRDDSYTVAYSQDYHCPVQVEWIIRRADLGGGVGRSRTTFVSDTRLPPPRARHDDYSRSGYDRGHMVPSEDRQRSVPQNGTTFRMSNVAPQVPSLNRGAWLQTEERCRQLARLYDSVKVTAEILFLDSCPRYIGKVRIRVPSHFRKVVRVARTDSILYIWTFANE